MDTRTNGLPGQDDGAPGAQARRRGVKDLGITTGTLMTTVVGLGNFSSQHMMIWSTGLLLAPLKERWKATRSQERLTYYQPIKNLSLLHLHFYPLIKEHLHILTIN